MFLVPSRSISQPGAVRAQHRGALTGAVPLSPPAAGERGPARPGPPAALKPRCRPRAAAVPAWPRCSSSSSRSCCCSAAASARPPVPGSTSGKGSTATNRPLEKRPASGELRCLVGHPRPLPGHVPGRTAERSAGERLGRHSRGPGRGPGVPGWSPGAPGGVRECPGEVRGCPGWGSGGVRGGFGGVRRCSGVPGVAPVQAGSGGGGHETSGPERSRDAAGQLRPRWETQ